jgi:hypothetical protein
LIPDEEIGGEESEDIHQSIPTHSNGTEFNQDWININSHGHLLILQYYGRTNKDSSILTNPPLAPPLASACGRQEEEGKFV